jgi:23S rRNA pseudouridine1911/1915/1917 synthase
MLFALSTRGRDTLIDLFSRHEIRRTYLAVVHGRIDQPRTIDSWLVRDRGDGLRGSAPPGPDAKQAITHLRPIEHLGDAYTLIECRLETGRTHQIRIHLAEIGHMLCGEKLYVRPRADAPVVEDASGAPRQALHSADLQFTHPITHRAMHVTSPLPLDLARWIDRLRTGQS